jgi:hypothetical protein
MRPNVKALGLAFVALVAIGALAGSAAHASNAKFTAAEFPAVAKGVQEGTENYFEWTPGHKVECSTATYQATLGAAGPSLTVTPHYAGCREGRTITLNGCHFAFETAGTEKNGATPGTADVICPSGKTIEIKGAFGICELHIQGSADGKNQNLKGVTFTNVANGDVTVDINFEGIHYTETDTSFCPYEGNTTETTAKLVNKVLISGFLDSGKTEPHTTTNVNTYVAGPAVNVHVR